MTKKPRTNPKNKTNQPRKFLRGVLPHAIESRQAFAGDDLYPFTKTELRRVRRRFNVGGMRCSYRGAIEHLKVIPNDAVI